MIIVNIEIPMLGKSMDFQVDENAAVYELRDAILENLDRSMTARIDRQSGDFLLWQVHNGKMLDMNRSGAENGLESGSMLLLA